MVNNNNINSIKCKMACCNTKFGDLRDREAIEGFKEPKEVLKLDDNGFFHLHLKYA